VAAAATAGGWTRPNSSPARLTLSTGPLPHCDLQHEGHRLLNEISVCYGCEGLTGCDAEYSVTMQMEVADSPEVGIELPYYKASHIRRKLSAPSLNPSDITCPKIFK